MTAITAAEWHIEVERIRAEYMRLWWKRYCVVNKGKRQATVARSYRKYREKNLARVKQYYFDHRGERLAYTTQYYQAHREERLAYGKRYRAAGRDKATLLNKGCRETRRDKLTTSWLRVGYVPKIRAKEFVRA